MRINIYLTTFAAIFACSNLIAADTVKNMFKQKVETIEPKLNSISDFINIKATDNLSYSFIVEAQMVVPAQGFTPGHTAFDTSPTSTLSQGSALTFDTNIVPGVSGYMVISDSDSELSVIFNAKYSNSPSSTKTTTAPIGSNIHIAGTGSETGDTTEFSAANLTNLFKNINGIACVRAFALKNKSLAITSQVGLRVQYIQNNYSVRGTKASDSSYAGYLGNQESTAAELYGAICSSVLVYDNDKASVAIGADLHYSAGAQFNYGFYNNYTETTSYVRTVTQNSKLTPISPSGYSGQELSLIYVSKPQTSQDTAFRLSVGLGFENLFNKDMIQSLAVGLPADINYFQANVRLTITI